MIRSSQRAIERAGRRAVQDRLRILPKTQRRHYAAPQQEPGAEASKASKIAPPPTSAKTIPGPIWLWTEPLNSYTRMHSRRPHTVQFISAIIIYLIGDLTAQNIAPSLQEEDEAEGGKPKTFMETYDPYRTARALFIGGSAAIPGYHWFVFLARNFNYASKAGSIVVKVLINQVVFTPIFNTYFFGMQSLLTGAGLSQIVERVQNTVPRSWVNSWKLWPAVTAFSFAFVRVELRGLFAGVIAIGWQAYLSVLNSRAAKIENAAKEESATDVKTMTA